MLVALAAALASIPALAGPCGRPASSDAYEQLDRGFHALYDRDFAGGEKTFVAWATQQPRNPLGSAARAAGYLFQEFDRLGVLKEEIFTDDERFERRNKLFPDPELKASLRPSAFAGRGAGRLMLARDPASADALLAKTLVNGLRADYAALIEKRNMASLSYAKEARRWAERLLKTDGSCYDAYLALGAEKYAVAIKPAVVRWLARLGGARADREQGIRELMLTAENGRFLRPFGKLLLVLAAQREHDRATAGRLLTELQQEFPNNPLYRDELSKLGDGSNDAGNC